MVKAAARGLATAVVVPELASFWVRAQVFGRERAFEGSSQLLALVPGITGQYLRAAFLRRVLERCDAGVSVGFGTVFSKTGARIGANVYIGPHCHVGLVEIGDDVLIASGVHLPSGGQTHGTADPSVPIREQEGKLVRVRIGAGAWIGSGTVVMADVGAGTVVGAGAVVTRPLPEGVVAAGVPARVIRRRDEGDKVTG